MNTTQAIKEIDNLIGLWKNNNKLYDNLKKLLMVDPESPFFLQMDENFNNYVRMVSIATGINLDALNWFIWENYCGKKKLECYKPNGKGVIIKNSKTFVEFELSE